MAKKKAPENRTVICQDVHTSFLGDASIFTLTIPRVHKEAFKIAFETAFKDVVTDNTSNKIKSGVFCDTDSGKTPYTTAILVVPPVFPSNMQKFLVAFCQQHGLQLNRYIPDSEPG